MMAAIIVHAKIKLRIKPFLRIKIDVVLVRLHNIFHY